MVKGNEGSTRKRGRPKGSPVSEKQRAAIDAGRAKNAAAAKARKQARQDKRASGAVVKPRWAMLRDGELKVRDLDDEELIRLEVSNEDGTWTGRRGPVTPRHISMMEAERIRRLKRKLAKLGDKAVEALDELLDDQDSPSVRLAATKYVLEHQIGKVPEVVHIGAETEWDKLQQTGFVISRKEEDVDPGELDNEGHDVVQGELEGAS